MIRGFVVLLLLATACDQESPGSPRPAPAQPVVVTQDSKSGPASCRPQAVGELMVGFLSDVNTGRDPMGSFSSTFQWYSMTEGDRRKEGRHFVAYDLADAAAYFERRADHGENMKLIELTVSYDAGRDLGHITYLIERTADDTARYGTKVVGKGAIACPEGKIELLSMGMDKGFPPPGSDSSCPEPRRTQPDAAVVCAD